MDDEYPSEYKVWARMKAVSKKHGRLAEAGNAPDLKSEDMVKNHAGVRIPHLPPIFDENGKYIRENDLLDDGWRN